MMAEGNVDILNNQLDLDQIQQDAQHRWLRTAEVYEILCNYQKFLLRPIPPSEPTAGSLFLFDRKVTRKFRNDGHRWRKKKDGKTIKEAHEKLKLGNVEVLNCYYAHGENNVNFQRRCYWMLDKQLQDIVLVHYMEVTKVHAMQDEKSQSADSGSLVRSSPGLDYGDTRQDFEASSFTQQSYGGLTEDKSFHSGEMAGYLERNFFGSMVPEASLEVVPDITSMHEQNVNVHQTNTADPDSTLNPMVDFHEVFPSTSSMHEQNVDVHQTSTADFLSNKLTDARLDADWFARGGSSKGKGVFPGSGSVFQVHSDSQAVDSFTVKPENCTQVDMQSNDEVVQQKRIDGFGRWMDENYWSESVGPSVSEDQLFSICDVAPDWAYSGAETKVLIVGRFLGNKKHPSGTKWCCMFGEIEVSAKVVTDNVIRCQVPFHAPGSVPFYVTCSNRLACSEVREFQYLENPSGVATCSSEKIAMEDECGFLFLLTKLLSLTPQRRKWLDCSVVDCDKCKLKDVICSLKSNMEVSERYSKELLIQYLLKDKLYDWLLCEAHDMGKGLCSLDENGLGVIHLVAALGYEWAIGPIAAAGLSVDFRDVQGRTALHWASLYGREEVVDSLLRLGTFAGAVDNPTPLNPRGQTTADLASSKGHKGIISRPSSVSITRSY